MAPRFSLIITRYGDGASQALIPEALFLRASGLEPEIIIAAGTGEAPALKLAGQHAEVVLSPCGPNRGATLRAALEAANGDFIGFIDAGEIHAPPDFAALLAPCLEGRADAVFGSRRLGARCAPAFWRAWQRPFLTLVAGMLGGLDLADPFCPCKIFTARAAGKIVPGLAGNGPGLEAEIAARAAAAGLRVLERPLLAAECEPCQEEAMSLGRGLRALYDVIHHCAPFAPLPAQMLIYLFIGAVSLAVNLLTFVLLLGAGLAPGASVLLAFACASGANYLLCIAILFRHKARWSGPAEAAAFLGVVLLMGLVDYSVTLGLLAADLPPVVAKFYSSIMCFFINFFLRRQVVFRSKTP